MALYQGEVKVAGGNTPMIKLTKAEYDALTTNEKLGNIYMTTDEVESGAVATVNSNGLMSAWDKALINKYVTATAGSDGDFYITLQGVLTINDVISISFPTATNGISNARLSIDGGATYKNITLSTRRIASEVASRKLSFVYDGTDFVPLDIEFFPINYAPTITSASGTLTTVTINACSYILIGKMFHFRFDVTINNKGTGAGGFRISVPYIAKSFASNLGFETAVTGEALRVTTGATFIEIGLLGGLTAIVNNYRLAGTISYEI